MKDLIISIGIFLILSVLFSVFGVAPETETHGNGAREQGVAVEIIQGMGVEQVQTTTHSKIKEGSYVVLKADAKTYTGGGLAPYVYKRTHIVKELKNDRAVITYKGVVVAAVNVNDLTLV